MAKGGWVYIMANRYRGGTYVGVTADLVQRVGTSNLTLRHCERSEAIQIMPENRDVLDCRVAFGSSQ